MQSGSILAWGQVDRRVLAASIDFDVELQPVTFVEASHARAFDRADVHKCIGLPVIAGNKAEALHRIEELDRSGGAFAGQLALQIGAHLMGLPTESSILLYVLVWFVIAAEASVSIDRRFFVVALTYLGAFVAISDGATKYVTLSPSANSTSRCGSSFLVVRPVSQKKINGSANTTPITTLIAMTTSNMALNVFRLRLRWGRRTASMKS